MQDRTNANWDEFHDEEIVDWKRVRAAIEHENTLTHHRLTWLMTSQGFLLAAFTLVFQASTNHIVTPNQRILYQCLLGGLAITGILVSAWMSLGIQTAVEQHDELERWWRERPKQDKLRHPEICGQGPRFIFKLPYSAFGGIFVLCWLVFCLVIFAEYFLSYMNTIASVVGAIVAVVGFFVFGFLFGRRRPAKAYPKLGDAAE